MITWARFLSHLALLTAKTVVLEPTFGALSRGERMFARTVRTTFVTFVDVMCSRLEALRLLRLPPFLE
jgi:hypothetical protein